MDLNAILLIMIAWLLLILIALVYLGVIGNIRESRRQHEELIRHLDAMATMIGESLDNLDK